VITLRPHKSFVFRKFQQAFGTIHASALQRKSFSSLAIPTLWQSAPDLVFQGLEVGESSATLIGRRSGAQRGALEDKLRPEVFLDAPCIFPSIQT
jgi:hypothetical protein